MHKYESDKEIVEGVVAGDNQAILALLQAAAPGWANVTYDGLKTEPLTGGYSGAALYQVSAVGAEPPAVVVRVSGGGIPTAMTELLFWTTHPGVPAAALKAWSTGATHESVYCVDDPRFPQVTVTEYIAGKTGDADLMNGKDAPQYCHAMGEAVAWMHTRDTQWFDQGVGKDEEHNAVARIDSATDRAEILQLGRYDTYGKYFIDTLVTALKTEGGVAVVAEIGQRIFGLLEPNTLMGRLVVGHGDLKYDNTMIRSSSNAEDPQIVLIDYDRVMRLTAGCDLGSYLHDGETRKYPSLTNRRALAQGYIDGCKNAGVDMTTLGRCTVDEVVLDMEAGLLMRSLWVSTVTTTLAPKMGWVVNILREGVSRASDVLEQAKTDELARQKILEKGSARTVGKGFAIGMLFKSLLGIKARAR